MFVPTPFTSPILFGKQKTGLPSSSARFAVMELPLLNFASVTNTPKESPAIILFLIGKFFILTFVSGEYSLIIHPLFFIIFLNKFLFFFGNMFLNPDATTAIVPPLFLIEF